jgi:hypothetical protein
LAVAAAWIVLKMLPASERHDLAARTPGTVLIALVQQQFEPPVEW